MWQKGRKDVGRCSARGKRTSEIQRKSSVGYCVTGSGNSTRKYCPERDGDVEIVTSDQLWTDEMIMRMFVDEERVRTH
jgi:hypothetical protein